MASEAILALFLQKHCKAFLKIDTVLKRKIVMKPTPLPPVDSKHTPLDARMADWLDFARYSIYLTEEGDWTKKTEIGSWLPHKEAKEFTDQLNESLRSTGKRRGWASPAYGIQLHTPRIEKNGRAAAGDLVFIEKAEPFASFALSEVSVFRRFFTLGVVVSASESRGITIYRDSAGIHYASPRNPHVVSAQDVDVDALLKYVHEMTDEKALLKGQYGRPSEAAGLLVRFQRIREAVYPVMPEMSI